MISPTIMRLPSHRLQRISVRALANAHAHRGALPNFIIIGAQKAGTTSLYAYLRQHPNVLACAYKEVNYFDFNFHKGTHWYCRQFLDPTNLECKRGSKYVVGEATPYYLFHPLVAKRIRDTVPTARLIVLLRDPVTRTYSQYQHNLRKGRETLSFRDALERERRLIGDELSQLRSDPNYHSEFHHSFAYATRSCYASQIEEYLKYFDRSQLLVLRSEDLFTEPAVPYCETLEFLGLRYVGLKDKSPRNTGTYDHRKIPGYQELREFFAPHNKKLYDLVGVDFGW
jgi:hypothetical protein